MQLHSLITYLAVALSMNNVVIIGRVKHKKKIEQYIHMLAKELNIHRMWSKTILVKFRTKLPDDVQGLCWGDYNDGYVEIKIARESVGEPVEYDEMLRTIAHEMVHARQYLRKQLNPYTQAWMGKKPRNYKYENRPWEKEAHGLEAELYKKCWNVIPYNKKL